MFTSGKNTPKASIYIAFLSFLFSGNSFSQEVNNNVILQQSNWQQKVDHKITVKLDVIKQELDCHQTISYTNNSPNVLTEIWFHCLPNAFKNNKTGYADESLTQNKAKFLCAPRKDRGEMNGLDFLVNGVSAPILESDKFGDEVIKIVLPFPLQPSQTILITTPFKVKIPAMFSRLGKAGNLYSITQWYPKPAVYDVNGWNLYDYKDIGEYYSEFGNYEVQIEVPSNYIVAATGNLQTETEIAFMDSLNANSKKTDAIAAKTKTLVFKEENVLDFAWFTSPDFIYKKSTVTLSSGENIRLNAYSIPTKTNLDKLIKNMELAIVHYSKNVGPYPYKNCSVVIGGLEAAEGMEYPTITICKDDAAGTVIHEIGHNWFQNMIGSNERLFPWMDESINTYYQNTAENENFAGITPDENFSAKTNHVGARVFEDFGNGQNVGLHSETYTEANYGSEIYTKGPLYFAYLQEFLGKRMFDSCMKTYFKEWQYKHPLPKDIQNTFEKISGKKLDWFFTTLLHTPMPDFSVGKITKHGKEFHVRINDVYNHKIPVKIGVINNGKRQDIWLKNGDTTIVLPNTVSQLEVNYSGKLLEKNYLNNNANLTKKLFKKASPIRPYMFKYFNQVPRGTNSFAIIPNVFTFNYIDGYTPGLWIFNTGVPRKKIEFTLAPSFGLRSKEIVGLATIQKNIYIKKGALALIETGLEYRRFSLGEYNNYFDANNSGGKRVLFKTPYNHFNWKTKLNFRIKNPEFKQELLFNLMLNRLDETQYKTSIRNGTLFENQNFYFSRAYENQSIQIKYTLRQNKTLSPGLVEVRVENTQSKNADEFSFMKFNFKVQKFIPYLFRSAKNYEVMSKLGARIKLFGTSFIYENFNTTNRPIHLLITGQEAQGSFDYLFEELTANRAGDVSETMNNFTLRNRIANTSAMGIRSLLPIPFVTDKYAVGINLQTTFIPVQGLNHIFAYFDMVAMPSINMGSTSNTNNSEVKNYYTAGLGYGLYAGSDVTLEIAVPLLNSSNYSLPNTSPYKGFLVKFNINLSGSSNPFNGTLNIGN